MYLMGFTTFFPLGIGWTIWFLVSSFPGQLCPHMAGRRTLGSLPLICAPVLSDWVPTLMTSFNLCHLTGLISKFSHIGGLGFQRMNFRGQNLLSVTLLMHGIPSPLICVRTSHLYQLNLKNHTHLCVCVCIFI